MRLVVALVAVLVVACGGGDDKPLQREDLGSWAAGYCLAREQRQKDLQAASLAAGSLIGLDVDQRKQRAKILDDANTQAFQRYADQLRTLKPPRSAEALHAAEIAQTQNVVAAIEAAGKATASATSVADIEASNARFRIVTTNASNALEELGANLPADLKAALAGVTVCGREPLRPAPTPTPQR